MSRAIKNGGYIFAISFWIWGVSSFQTKSPELTPSNDYFQTSSNIFQKSTLFSSDTAIYHSQHSMIVENRSDTFKQSKKLQYYKGAIIRGDSTIKELALLFTGDEFGDGGEHIYTVLKRQGVKASFFLTGNFYRNQSFGPLIKKLNEQQHYLGPHGDRHLLCCDWKNRDSLLITNYDFKKDLGANQVVIKKHNIDNRQQFFLPPYEWYNDTIAGWSREAGLQLINFTPGTLSAADYTYPGLGNYRSSEVIFQSIVKWEEEHYNGLNGFLLVTHIGTDARRSDKFYYRLDSLITTLKQRGYVFKRVDEML